MILTLSTQDPVYIPELQATMMGLEWGSLTPRMRDFILLNTGDVLSVLVQSLKRLRCLQRIVPK